MSSRSALFALRTEERTKEEADIPPSQDRNDLCSTRLTLALYQEQPWGDRLGASAVTPSSADTETDYAVLHDLGPVSWRPTTVK